ncbi:MAG: cytochrome c [Leptolyngbyaceae cyanobacterium bins.59]|nr:cytochrome c [Leptolyngbyaceae cyanobacterium bins.59]
MDNPLTKPEVLMQKLGLLVLAIGLTIFLLIFGIHQWRLSDPYIKSVLSLAGNPIQGHAIFQMNCSGCHGLMADGHVGPSLKNISERKSDFRLIYQVISGQTPPMPQFQPSPQEMADLLSYLKSL